MVSYDVVSLYTKVPIQQALEIIQQKLDIDAELPQRTQLSATDRMCSLCLKSTVFTFREKLYAQTEGLPMGSPLSPVVANIFMENFENIAILTFRRPPKISKKYVDDTFVILSKYSARSFLGHINNINEATQFTVDIENENGELPFLDCLIIRNPDGTFDTTVYRIPKFPFLPLISNKARFYQGPLPKSRKIMLNTIPTKK